ncbi:zinc-ribbon domain-containing protein [Lactiplantibacillus plantarum]|uniref:zinc ribbon domain-containing protein n=1 Tax=Lactiplantibacillus plantarum TaxID=1590 RepID=UPI0009B25214|nr:zinc ribbon domain-containing protein [Lactiplantibacillus plantarum]QSE56703.1 zinc ribbon domain-containing protein [Lactiplantibacillus plantarum]QXN28565.1 zinc ribbon domain-containing protein [Lactiplantibacillus plantarum subsp. plantarum]QXN31531.1 zinc ribbon domain-containing protein [Lactiplantibacillus plantarum subsp. plantarum]RCI90899.1 zinc ribbon domain-containing protein [Lactiplantibacillus plantarum]UJS13919.1 zinc ribbon domain-containing protein [Lactiplantibacillus pl
MILKVIAEHNSGHFFECQDKGKLSIERLFGSGVESMKHCSNCGKELKDEAKFCPNCGQSVLVSNEHDEQADVKSNKQQASTDQKYVISKSHDLDEVATPRVTQKQKTNSKQSLIIAVIVAAVIILGGFSFVKKRVVVSRDQLASNITKAVQNQDGKLFLKQFSKDDQNLKFSDIGSKSVVKDIHNHSRDSLSEVGRIITDGQRVSGTEVKYHFSVESKKVLGMFTSYYLTTRRTPVRVLDYTGSGGPVTIKLRDADNQRVTKQLLNSGFFPGKYNFNVTLGDTQGNYWIWAAGDGETIDLTLTSDD